MKNNYMHITPEPTDLDNMPLMIQNAPENLKNISGTNFWERGNFGANGIFFVSGCSGAIRLLIPTDKVQYIAEMKTGKYVEINFGKNSNGMDRIEIVFIDGSDNPFCINLHPHQFVPHPADEDYGFVNIFDFIIVTCEGGYINNDHIFKCKFFKREIIS